MISVTFLNWYECNRAFGQCRLCIGISGSENTAHPLYSLMSANRDGPQTSNTLSTAPPRKRSRQESSCDIDSGIRPSEEGSGSGSGRTSESGEHGDGRHGKRARSEGHGDLDVSRDSVSWSMDASNYHAPAPLPANSPTTSTSRYLTSSTPVRAPSPVESFIPLPAISLSGDSQRDSGNQNCASPSTGSVGTAHRDLARSMAFDEQMDVLRRSPDSLPSLLLPDGQTSTGIAFIMHC